MLRTIWRSVGHRFLRRGRFLPIRLPAEPFVIELVELAAVWLPHTDRSQPVASSDSTASAPVVEGEVGGSAASTDVPELSTTVSILPEPRRLPVRSNPLQTAAALPPGASTPQANSLRARYAYEDFMQSFITPNEALLRAQHVYEPIVAMLSFLDQHGECPSLVVISPERDHEAGELYPVRQALLRVTLKDHTFHVTDFALKILKDTYRDYQPLIPKVLAAAIGHDLGKSPEFRTATVYTMGDHTAASSVQVHKCFQGHEVPWLPDVIHAIGSHHRASKEPLDVLLKQADERARQYELSQHGGGLRVEPFEQWCQIPELLQRVAVRVNVMKRQNTWEALSHKDVVYLIPDALLDAARNLAKTKGVVELGLIRADDREPMLRRLVGCLRAQQALGEDVGDGYYGRYYQVVMAKRANTKRMYLIPVKKEAFGEVHTTFEGRKEGLLSLVTDIRHVR